MEEDWNYNSDLLLTMLVLQAFRTGDHVVLEERWESGDRYEVSSMEELYFRYNKGTLMRDDNNFKLVGWKEKPNG